MEPIEGLVMIVTIKWLYVREGFTLIEGGGKGGFLAGSWTTLRWVLERWLSRKSSKKTRNEDMGKSWLSGGLNGEDISDCGAV